MIVVAIISLLAVIAVPSFLRAREQSQNAKFMNALRVASGAFEEYATEYGTYPADVTRAIVPAGMSTYFGPKFDWTKPTPLGGNWDWDANVFGFIGGISAVGTSGSVAQFTAIDGTMDNGDLSTGQFKITAGDRYTYILQ